LTTISSSKRLQLHPAKRSALLLRFLPQSHYSIAKEQLKTSQCASPTVCRQENSF